MKRIHNDNPHIRTDKKQMRLEQSNNKFAGLKKKLFQIFYGTLLQLLWFTFGACIVQHGRDNIIQ